MSNQTQYSININAQGAGTIVAVEDGGDKIRTWTSADRNFNHVVAAVHRGLPIDEIDIFRIPREITRLSERVTIEEVNGQEVLHFDGRPVEGAINETAIRYRYEGRSIENIVLFMERLSDNVTANSRTELFKWLNAQRLEIDPEGYVIGYRGLKSDRHSQHAGGAFVTKRYDDGTWGVPRWVQGHVPNFVGTIVSMDRNAVDDNTGVGCSQGLHVGSEEYARSWADRDTTIVVRVDPADVVAVPDGEHSKMRVCRYEIIGDLDEADHEPETSEVDEDVVPSVEGTDEVLDEIIPEKIRSNMSRTQKFTARFRRNNDE